MRRSFVAIALVTLAGVLCCAPAALAHHSLAATYTGTHAGGGGVDFDVSNDGSTITRFRATDVPGNNGCTFVSTEVNGSFAITNHAFNRTSSTFAFGGSFPSNQNASGTFQITNTGVCTSGTVAWTATTNAAAAAQCRDGEDNDTDGLTDFPDDPGCSATFDDDETNAPTAQCSDGMDNDGDGLTDFPNDPGCVSSGDNDEFNPPSACSDGFDNDGDGLTDFPADPGCSTPTDPDEFNFPPFPPPPPPPAGPPAPPGPPPPPSGAATGPSVNVARIESLTIALSRGVGLFVSCARACGVTSTALLDRRLAKRFGIVSATVKVGQGRGRLTSAGEVKVAVKLTRRARQKLRRASKVALTIRTKVTDSTGTRTFNRKVTLSRSARPNRPPVFPSPVRHTRTTSFQYDDAGRLMGGVTTITVVTPATDPDGDPITYSWTASNGAIASDGLTARWTRSMDFGQFRAGDVTVTARDPRGGSDSFTFSFERGAARPSG